MKKRIYKVVVCKNCGHVQITYAESIYRCFRCGKATDVESSTVIFKTLDLGKARERLINLKSIKQVEFKRWSKRG